MRGCTWLLLLGAASLLEPSRALDAAPAVNGNPSGGSTPDPMRDTKPNFLVRGVRSAVLPPLKAFAEAPPITRSWVSASVLMAILSSQRVISLRKVCFSERDVIYKGEWWRLLVNFFFMGDSFKSVFFWFQLHHFWECLKVGPASLTVCILQMCFLLLSFFVTSRIICPVHRS